MEGFGIFADKKISALADQLNVFYGPNESGKSTILAFIRRVLYGYPDRRSRLNMYPPLKGGKHGGWLKIEDGDGNELRIERYFGSAPVIIDASGNSRGEYELNNTLGNSPVGVFKNVYAFSLSELQNFETLNNEEVRNRLYSAGTGMGNISVSDVQKKIDSRAEKLFKERGSKQEIAVNLAECVNIDQQLRDIQKRQGKFDELHKRLNSITNKIEELTEEKRALSKKLKHDTSIKIAYANWVDIIAYEKKLEELPVINFFPENGLLELSKIEERIDELRQEKTSYEADIKKEELSMDAISFDSSLITLRNEIKKLQKSTDKYKSAIRDYPKISDKKERQYDELMAELKEIGPDWDIEKLNSFDTSIPLRKTIEKHKEEYVKSTEKMRAMENQLAHLTTSYNNTIEEIKQFDKENKYANNSEPLDLLKKKSKAISNIRVSIGEIKELQMEIKNIDERMELMQSISPTMPSSTTTLPIWPSYALLTTGLIVMALSIIYSVPLIGVINIVITGFVAIVLYDISKRKTHEQPLTKEISPTKLAMSDRRKKSIEEKIKSIKNSVVPSLKILDLKTIPDERRLEDIAIEIRSGEKEIIKMEEATKLRNALVKKLKVIKEQRGELEDKLKESRKENARIMNKWREWLKSKDIEQDLSYDTAIELFQIIRNCREKLKNMRELEKRLEGLSQFIAKFEKNVETVMKASGRDITDLDYLFEAEKIYADLEVALEAEESLKKYNLKINGIRIELEKTQEKLNREEKKLSNLLRNAEVSSVEEFKRKAVSWENRNKLLEKLYAEKMEIKKILGDDYEKYTEEFENLNLGELEETINVESKKLEDIEMNLDELKERKGGTQTDIRNIWQEEASSVLRLEKEAKMQLLKNLAEEWAILTIAKTMMENAIKKYEQERQPDIIKGAEKYLSTMTSGRYTHIISPMDEEKIYVIDDTGKRLEINELSRGTAEQLYLALRFGFIQEFNKRSTPLPIIIDDIFVNFDPKRFSYASKLMMDISKTNQLLYFTCHPEVKDFLKNDFSDVNVINLNVKV